MGERERRKERKRAREKDRLILQDKRWKDRGTVR